MRLNVNETAALFRVSTKTVYRWVRDGKIPGYRVNGSFRFDRAELLEWATANRTAVTPALVADPPVLTAPPALDTALDAGGIHYRIEGSDRDAVLRSVVASARSVDPDDRSLVFEALRAREDLASTAIGDGIALPHLRNPLRLRLERPSLALCFLDRPTDWLAPDGLPIAVLLVLLAPTVREVLQLHSRALFAMRDPGFRAAVRQQDSRDALHADVRRIQASFALRSEV